MAKYKVLVEMEGWGKNGEEVIDSDLWAEIIVEVPDSVCGDENALDDALSDAVDAFDFGCRRPNGYVQNQGKVK